MAQRLTATVGQQVIYQPPYWLNHGARPVVTTVKRVTASGWPVIEEYNKAFRPISWPRAFKAGDHELWPYSDEKLAELTGNAERREEVAREKREERERQQNEREQRLANELAETKMAYNDTLPVAQRTLLPDNSRLYILNGIVKEGHQKAFDILIVRICDEKKFDYPTSAETIKPVAYGTFLTDRPGFSVTSGETFDNDEEALWEMLRYRYFRWD